jgi:hypothetical protein
MKKKIKNAIFEAFTLKMGAARHPKHLYLTITFRGVTLHPKDGGSMDL